MTTRIDWLDARVAIAQQRLQEQTQTIVERHHPETEPTTVYGFDGQINMSKVLVKAAHGLNLNQKRLIIYAISKLHPHAPQPSQLIVKVAALDYASQ